ncbi:YagK/YfjJ domain-containing protein, partial [Enterobacter ludwigii]
LRTSCPNRIPVISKLVLVLDIYSSLSLIWRYSYCLVFQGATSEDYLGLVHYPENCRYILDSNDFNFEGEYNKLLNRLDYLAKLDTKVYGDGDRSFGCSRG